MKTVIKIGLFVGSVYFLKISGEMLYGGICAFEGLKHRYGKEKGGELWLELMKEGYEELHNAKKKKAE